jgi:hypothetical protein
MEEMPPEQSRRLHTYAGFAGSLPAIFRRTTHLCHTAAADQKNGPEGK